MTKHQRIAPDLKEQIITRIRTEGVTVKQAAADHGLSDRTIYQWLQRGADGGPTTSEVVRLRKERDELLLLIGELTVKLSATQKKS